MKSLSERLRYYRVKNGLSINEVARRLNVAPSTYRGWEGGVLIKGEPYQKLADILGVGLSELITGEKSGLLHHLDRIEEHLEAIKRTL